MTAWIILAYMGCAAVTAFAFGFFINPDKHESSTAYIITCLIWPIVWIVAFLALIYALGKLMVNRKEKKQ